MSLPVAMCLIRTTVPVISTHKMGRKAIVPGVLLPNVGYTQTLTEGGEYRISLPSSSCMLMDEM
jgi:hypothetical protein